jgi:hypothetical protein
MVTHVPTTGIGFTSRFASANPPERATLRVNPGFAFFVFEYGAGISLVPSAARGHSRGVTLDATAAPVVD